MGTVQSGYEYSAQELSLLNRVLDDEYKSVQLGRVAKISFRILEIAGYFLPFVLILAFALALLSNAFDHGLFSEDGLIDLGRIGALVHEIIDTTNAAVKGLVSPALVVLAIVLILNFRLFWKAFRQWRLSRRLTALELLDVEYRTPSRFPRIGKFRIAALLGPIGILVIFLSNMFRSGGAPHDEWRHTLVTFFLLIFLPVTLLLMDNLFRRLQVRLDYFKEVSALRMELEKYGTAASSLSKELATRLAGIERSRVLRESAEVSRTRLTELFVRPSYAVRKSDDAANSLAQLDGSDRLVIEGELGRLASLRSRAQTGPDSPSTLDVPGTSWRVIYEVERELREIHVISVIRQGENQN